jgi:hypothetical protein
LHTIFGQPDAVGVDGLRPWRWCTSPSLVSGVAS